MIQHITRTRHYVHGDCHEKNPNMYYCARCDLFGSALHFEDPNHISTRAQRYSQSLQSWERIAKNQNTNFYRPSNAENIISELAVADIKSEKAARSQLYSWLLRQTKRDDPVGDFARDLERDRSFPRTTNSLENIRSYLLDRHAAPEVILAFDEAYGEFRTRRKFRARLSLTQRFEIFKRDSYRCCICGASAEEGSRLEIDHKIAVANGGTNDKDNLWTLCFECNRGKGVHDI